MGVEVVGRPGSPRNPGEAPEQKVTPGPVTPSRLWHRRRLIPSSFPTPEQKNHLVGEGRRSLGNADSQALGLSIIVGRW